MFLGDGGRGPGQGQGDSQKVKRQRAGHPVMGGLRLQKDGAYNGIIGCAGHWMLCPVGGAGDWFSWDPGGSGSDPKDFGVGCGSEITIKTILAKGGDIPPPLPRPEIGHRDNKDPSNYLN